MAGEIKKLKISEGVIIAPPVDLSATITTGTITGGTIDNTPVGATTPSTGSFSSLTSNGVDVLTEINVKDLKNKTLNGSNKYEEIVTPSTPPPGFLKLYPKTDKKFYKLDSNGVEVELGSGASGGGGGEQNFIDDTVGFTTSANTTSVITNLSSEKLGEKNTYKIDVTASATTSDKASKTFSIPRGYEGRLLRLSFLVSDGANYADDDLEVIIVHDPNGTPTDVSSQNLSLIKKETTGYFQTAFASVDDDTKLEYAIEFRVKTASKAFALFVGEIKVDGGSLATADLKGWKTYNENDVTLSVVNASLSSVSAASYKPYKDPVNNTWRMTFNIRAVLSAADSSYKVLLSGVTFKNKTNFFQAVTLSPGLVGTTTKAYASPNTSEIVCDTSVAEVNIRLSGDVALESKPTWADFEPQVNLLDDKILYENARLKKTWSIAQDISTSTNLKPDVVNSSFTTSGINWDSNTGLITVDSSGSYSVNLQMQVTGTPSLNSNLTFKIAGSSIIARSFYSGVNSFFTLDINTHLQKGVNYEILFSRLGSESTIDTTTYDSYVSIHRLQDTSHSSPVGFAVAKDNKFGLVQVETLPTITLTDPKLGTTGRIKIDGQRVGKLVTLLIDIDVSGSSIGIGDITFLNALPSSFKTKASIYCTGNLISFGTNTLDSKREYILHFSSDGNMTVYSKEVTRNLNVTWTSTSAIRTTVTYITG